MRRVSELVRPRSASGKSKPAARRSAPWYRRRWPAIAVLTGVLTVGGLSTWLAMTGHGSALTAWMRDAAVQRTASLGMVVEDVLLEGRLHTPKAAVLRAVDVRRGQPILGIDPDRIAQRIKAISWVESVVVERRLPETLYVRIKERTPMALWQQNGKLALIDGGGVVLTRQGLDKFRGLMTVVGGDAPRHTPALLHMIAANPVLAQRVRAAVRVGGRRWNLRFDNGIDVRLPQRGAAAAWDRLGRLERQHGLLGHDIKAIDLRLPGRLIVRRKNAPPPPIPGRGGKQRGEKT
jgi:cell division protein FtsQ